MKPKGFLAIPILFLILGVLAVGTVVVVVVTHKTPPSGNTNLVACTQEAKLCPDGSYVGRTGPNCEFSACPRTNMNTVSITEKSLVYASGEVDKQSPFEPPTNVTFYKFGLTSKQTTKLFQIAASDLGVSDYSVWPHIIFCDSVKSFFARRGSTIEEVDLAGHVKTLDFTNTEPQPQKGWEGTDTGFALSPNCSKIIWSTIYRHFAGPGKEDKAINEIYVSNIDGSGKKLLQSVDQYKVGDSAKSIIQWGATNTNVVYLTDFAWSNNGTGGGLYSLDVNSGSLSRIVSIPLSHFVYGLSPDENYVSDQENFLIDNHLASFISNLKLGSTVPLNNNSNGSRIFSPDSSRLANVVIDSSFKPNLYIANIKGVNKLLITNTKIQAWLSATQIIGKQGDNNLVFINADNGSTSPMATTDGNIIFLGTIE